MKSLLSVASLAALLAACGESSRSVPNGAGGSSGAASPAAGSSAAGSPAAGSPASGAPSAGGAPNVGGAGTASAGTDASGTGAGGSVAAGGTGAAGGGGADDGVIGACPSWPEGTPCTEPGAVCVGGCRDTGTNALQDESYCKDGVWTYCATIFCGSNMVCAASSGSDGPVVGSGPVPVDCDNPVPAGTPCSEPAAHCGGPCSNSWQADNVCKDGVWTYSGVVSCGLSASSAPICMRPAGIAGNDPKREPCCPSDGLDCSGKPDGYPGFSCLSQAGSWCYCTCAGESAVCGC
jgi:hypothetical protein